MPNLYEDPVIKLMRAAEALLANKLIAKKWPMEGLGLEMADRIAGREGFRGAYDKRLPVVYEPLIGGFRWRKPLAANQMPEGVDSLMADIEALNALWEYKSPRWDSYGVTR